MSRREALIGRAYRIAFSRSPERAEVEAAVSFFERHRAVLAAEMEKPGKRGASLSLPDKLPDDADRLEAATLVDFCHMLINSNEFIYRN
jgi:hypothetical protein